MHIVNIMQCTNLGGMEQASLRLMQGLQQRGHSCEVVSVNTLGPLAEKLSESRIPAVGVPFLGKLGWRSHFRLKRAMSAVRADALLMTGPTLSGILSLGDLCRGRRILAVHFHHTGVKPAWMWREIYRVALRKFQAVTFPSDFIRREAEAILPGLASISHTVRNPLSLPARATVDDVAAARRQLQLPLGAPIVGNAGWLIPRKRFDVFLRCARAILDRHPQAIFPIAGDGPERQKLERLAAELELGGAVRWLGWLQDMTAFYRSLDVLLFNSDWDACGMTPVEAMSHAKPVVASLEQGGLGEVMECAPRGWLLPQHDVPTLAEMVVRLLDDKDLAAAVGAAHRERVARMNDLQEIVDRHERLFAGAGPGVGKPRTA